MQQSNIKCPSCKSTEMISGGIYGMEHNVCTKCGTMLEDDQFTVDVFEGGSKEVKADFDGSHYNYGFRVSKCCSEKSKNHIDGLIVMKRLMNGLDLPTPVRDTAKEYFKYTKCMNKLACAGAVVYLAMKDFHLPVTLRCIANFLQVSHFSIGRVMRVLEKKLVHKRTFGKTFELNELIPHLFSQAQFGVEEEKRRMLDLTLKKTDALLSLLKDCMATTGYAPHIIVLAAGFIVWKYLNITNWSELDIDADKLPKRPAHILTIKLYLSEVGICLPHTAQLTNKITLIKRVLLKLSMQIPWLSNCSPSKVIIHLNDILKYKSQIVDMTVKDLAEGKKDSNEGSTSKPEDEDVNSIKSDPEEMEETSGSSVIQTSTLLEGGSQASSGCKLTQDCPIEVENLAERGSKSSGKGLSFIRVTDLHFALQNSSKEENKYLNNKRKGESKESKATTSNGYDELLLISHPNLGKRQKKRESFRDKTFLLLP